VDFPRAAGGEDDAFELLRTVVGDMENRNGAPNLSGLKNRLRKRDPEFSEKTFGYGGFLQFVKAAQARGLVELDWDPRAEDYVVRTV
jgi:hypothetical protein